MVDGDSWLDKVMKLRKTLEAIDRTYKDGRDQALIAIWRTLEDAPDIWQQLYAEWPESELRLWAEDARTKLQFDLYYVKNHSLFLDVLILFETVRVILFREGAH